ncbi:FG-GAP-like repeat-containing protein [Polaromonas sp. LjRoot131]|uniref:FG-GAP-like repeat-containing protein n=1 Tax=Polaromonas sp. LjRoot131 TaxID=3342262 RepID=UPI003ED1002B
MQKKYCDAMVVTALCWLGVASMPAMAQGTTVAGTMPGQFAVNESGAATYRIPVQVPPGVAGMEPKLELSYNSQGGNGLLGMGWSLGGLSAITRCPRTMVHDSVRGGVNFDMNDRYCLDGQRLILVSGTYGTAGSEYKTELDSFSKIVASGTAGNGVASFTVQSKAGLTMEYGNTADSRIEAQGKPTARAWAVNKISDVKTNFMTFSYTEDSVNGDFYPSRIDYSGNIASGQAAANSIEFAYEARTGMFMPSFTAGSVMQYAKRMTGIKTYIGALAVKSYQLVYGPVATGKRPRLSQIQECDGQAIPACLAPISLEWTGNTGLMYTEWTNGNGLTGEMNKYEAFVLDLNGDGLADLIQTPRSAAGLFVSINGGDGNFQQWDHIAGLLGPANDYSSYFADLNGDGLPDLLHMSRTTNLGYVSINPGNGYFATWQHTTSLTGETNNYDTYLMDVNGDGLADLVQVAKNYSSIGVSINGGSGNFQTWSHIVGLTGPGNNFASYFADVNGDGLPDLVHLARNTNQGYISINPGNGYFSTWAYITSLPGPADSFNTHLIDVNADGIADLIQTSRTTAATYVSVNDGTGNFQAWSHYTGLLGSASEYDSYFADLDGDGLPDLVHVTRATNYGYISINPGKGYFHTWDYQTPLFGAGNSYTHYLADLDGDGLPDLFQISRYSTANWSTKNLRKMPDLLSTVSRPAGPVGTFIYSPLSKSATYTKDTGGAAATYPKLDLQYPQYVVSTVASSNGIGGTVTTQYSYGGLKAELGTGRGMLGFRWMKSKNLANNIESYTEFNQNWPLTGSVAKSETRLAGSGNAGVLKRTTNTYAQGTGSAAGTTFVYPSQSVEESWDLGGTQYPTVTNAYQYGQSPQYGDPTQISVSNSAGAGKTTVNEYWPANTGSGSWILGRLKKATVTSVAP